MKTAPTNKKVREIINSVREGKILPRPEFQRRLVWKIEDKNHFLDSIIRGYPFPEIYVADGDVDLETGEGTQLLVDGLQRVSTMVQYFEGSIDLKLTSVLPYKDLDKDQKTAFLQYDVAVRDLGTLDKDQIVEVFRRINATKYSLTDIEVSNAVYRGELKDLAEKLSSNSFFERNRVFGAQDMRRMGDLRFALLMIITFMAGYFNRDDKYEEFLELYNDEFPQRQEIEASLQKTFDFIEECGFHPKSRVWRKADLFTLIVEVASAFEEGFDLDPYKTVERLQNFYEVVEGAASLGGDLAGIYYKAALQASNDRLNRIRRGVIIANLIRSEDPSFIPGKLDNVGLLASTSSPAVISGPVD